MDPWQHRTIGDLLLPEAIPPPLPLPDFLPLTVPPEAPLTLDPLLLAFPRPPSGSSGSSANTSSLTSTFVHGDAERTSYSQAFAINDLHPRNTWTVYTDEAFARPADSGVSTKRRAPDDEEVVEYRPPKTSRITRSRTTSDDCNDIAPVRHAEDKLFQGTHWCTCGEIFSNNSALQRHLKNNLNPDAHPCPDCTRSFSRLDTLKRHRKTQHDDGKLECPWCHLRFRQDYLSEHLKSPKREECRMIAEALYLEANGLHVDVRPIASGSWISNVAKLVPLRRGDRMVRQAVVHEGPDLTAEHFEMFGEYAEHIANTIQHYRGMKVRPILRTKDEPCALCGMPLGSNTQELVRHITHHSSELAMRKCRCEDCEIDFRFRADLELHQTSAKAGHCGFEFLHDGSSHTSTGHHPASRSKSPFGNHHRMQITISRWESRQIRAHRVAIARLHAKLLQHEECFQHPFRYSLGNDELMCLELLSRLSLGSIDSFHSVPAWLQFLDSMRDDDTEGKLSTAAIKTRLESMARSGVMSANNSTSQLSVASVPTPTPKGSTGSYVDQLKAMRGPGGLKSKASGVLHRTKTMTRQILADNRTIETPYKAQYAGTVAA